VARRGEGTRQHYFDAVRASIPADRSLITGSYQRDANAVLEQSLIVPYVL
jgi:hypothetical protein